VSALNDTPQMQKKTHFQEKENNENTAFTICHVPYIRSEWQL